MVYTSVQLFKAFNSKSKIGQLRTETRPPQPDHLGPRFTMASDKQTDTSPPYTLLSFDLVGGVT